MEAAKNELVDICLFLRGGFNIASISEIAETWLRIAQMSHRVEVTGYSKSYVKKWNSSSIDCKFILRYTSSTTG